MSEFMLIGLLRRVAGTIVRRGQRNNFIHRCRRSVFGDPGLPAGSIRSVLVLCHGNLFRSPFAEFLLASNLPSLCVSSAGLHAADNHASPPRAIALAASFGVDLEDHRTTPLSEKIISEADLILVMEGAQLADLARLYPLARPKIRVLGDFLDAHPRELPDPWSEDEIVGRVIFARVEQAVVALSDRLAEKGVPERLDTGSGR